jgi:hypothetical protein
LEQARQCVRIIMYADDMALICDNMPDLLRSVRIIE